MNERVSTLPEMVDLWQETVGWQPTHQQIAQFQQFYDLIIDSNRQMNLTRITEPVDFWEKHLWDSLRGIFPAETSVSKLLLPSLPLNAIDIGTGAGFPGVPIAIAHPEWAVTLLDSTSKKVNFLQTALKEMGIHTANTLVDRVEQVGRSPQHRETYDIALIRAVASATVCAEYALPLLKPNGLAVLYRGQWSEDETSGLESAVKQLGGEVVAIEEFVTPLTHGLRHCVYLQKISSTPQEFPRAIGIPVQKPLG